MQALTASKTWHVGVCDFCCCTTGELMRRTVDPTASLLRSADVGDCSCLLTLSQRQVRVRPRTLHPDAMPLTRGQQAAVQILNTAAAHTEGTVSSSVANVDHG